MPGKRQQRRRTYIHTCTHIMLRVCMHACMHACTHYIIHRIHAYTCPPVCTAPERGRGRVGVSGRGGAGVFPGGPAHLCAQPLQQPQTGGVQLTPQRLELVGQGVLGEAKLARAGGGKCVVWVRMGWTWVRCMGERVCVMHAHFQAGQRRTCPTLVRSRQSTQFVRNTPRSRGCVRDVRGVGM